MFGRKPRGPFDEIDRMMRNFEKMFRFSFDDEQYIDEDEVEEEEGEKPAKIRVPNSDIWETDKEVIATIEIPGVNKEDIDLEVNGRTLEVRVMNKREDKKERGVEQSYRKNYGFYRKLALPCEVRKENIKATYNNGILEVRMEKVSPSVSKKIKVE